MVLKRRQCRVHFEPHLFLLVLEEESRGQLCCVRKTEFDCLMSDCLPTVPKAYSGANSFVLVDWCYL
jgi:hypothetical protein